LDRAWSSTDEDAAAVRAQLAEVIAGSRRSTAVVAMVLESLQATSSFLHVQRFKRHDWLAG
jgi:hypothetical protein